MNTNKRHIKFVLLILVAVVIILVGMYAFEIGFFANDDLEPVLYNEADVKMLTESYKTEFMIYGSELNFDNSCHTRYIDETTESTLTSDESFVYKVLVLNDLDGVITFTEENGR